jgi:hypothetical protein
LFDACAARNANEVAGLLDSPEERVRKVGVVDELVAKQLKRRREN